MNAFSGRYTNRILSASGRDERPDVGDGRDAVVEQDLQEGAHVLEGIVGVDAGADEGIAFHRGQDVLLRVIEGLLVGVEDGPEHRHGAHAVGTQARAGERVHAVRSSLFQKAGHQAATSAGNQDRDPLFDLGP